VERAEQESEGINGELLPRVMDAKGGGEKGLHPAQKN